MVQRSGGRGPRRERAEEEARRLPGIPFEEVPPADRDAAVNGPEWDFHVMPTVEMPTATETAARKRVIAQARRRVQRQEADQILINDLQDQLERAERLAECKTTELANFHQGAADMRREQAVHRARRVYQVDNLILKIRALEAAASRHEEEMAREREGNAIAQLLIAQYKAKEDEEAEQELRAQHRRSRDDNQYEDELDTLRNHNEQLRELLEAETQKAERLERDRSKSIKNLAEAESGVRRQGAELLNRDGTIATLTSKLDKVTRDSIKKSTTISELQRDFDKMAAKAGELRTQRTGLRNRLDDQAALLQTAVDERDSELDNLRALLSISSEDIATLEAAANQSRDDKERLQLRSPRRKWRWQRCRTNWQRHGFKQEPTERRRYPCPAR